MQNILFQTRELSFNNSIFYNDITILKDKVTFIVGESGAGKTTLLKMFNGVITPSGGEIFYNGKNLAELDTICLRKEVSLISQEVFLFDRSIKENFQQFYEYREQACLNDEEINKLLSLCCIPISAESSCTTLSAGERQRVYLAIFLSFLPKVLLLDEPTSALDCNCSSRLLENIISFCKESDISIVIVSHDRELTEKYGEEIISIK